MAPEVYLQLLWEGQVAVAVALHPAELWSTDGSPPLRRFGAFLLKKRDRPPGPESGEEMGWRVSTFDLHRGPEQRTLHLVQAIQWPDASALPPATLAAGASLIRGLTAGTTVAVHCFAGQGRTGTLIATLSLGAAFRSLGAGRSVAEETKSALNCLLRLRLQRPGLVESPAQWAAAVASAHLLAARGETDVSA